jgi:predicted small metal-binding protein
MGEARSAIQVLVLRCECGVESRGDADELVRLVQEHARSVHNMTATREQILERARPA